LKTARLQQEATAEILRAVANAAGDAADALQLIAETTARLFGASSVTLRIVENDRWAGRINVGEGAHRITAAVPPALLTIDGHNLPGTVFRENRQIHVPDLDNPDPAYADWPGIKPAREAGTRVISGTPLRRGSVAIGVLVIHRDRQAPFTSEELALQQSFADQAVIAIENARLFNEVQTRNRELTEALEQQTATGAILRAIAASRTEIQPVLEAVTESAAKLCDAQDTTIFLRRGDVLAVAAHEGVIALNFAELPLARDLVTGRAVLDRQSLHVSDLTAAEEEYPRGAMMARTRGFRTILATPLLRDGEAIGALMIRRSEVRPFTEKQISLLRTFADQAVIAIENARLFNEVQEALKRETATSEILRVISQSPTDARPVFDAIVLAAVRSLRCDKAFVLMRDGDVFVPTAGATPQGPMDLPPDRVPIDPTANFPSRAILAGETLHLPDWSGIELPEHERNIRAAFGINSALYLPLLREGECVGVISVNGTRSNAFGAKEIAQAESFRDQALIAIENARLFNEVRAKTRDLEESLQQQTATADVLKVISRSAFDLQSVLHTLVESAAKLCDADKATITRQIDGVFYRAESYGFSEGLIDQIRDIPVIPERGTMSGRALLEGKPIQVADVLSDSEYTFKDLSNKEDFRTCLGIPMMRNGAPIGVLVMVRTKVRPFNDKQIELVQTFADQASSRSKTRGCSTKCRRARTTSKKPSRSRLRPPTF
jgi:GAF domain-containing protein